MPMGKPSTSYQTLMVLFMVLQQSRNNVHHTKIYCLYDTVFQSLDAQLPIACGSIV